MTHNIIQKVKTHQGNEFEFHSECNGEDDSLYDTKVIMDGKDIGVISGDDILEFIIAVVRGYSGQNHIKYHDPIDTIQDFLI